MENQLITIGGIEKQELDFVELYQKFITYLDVSPSSIYLYKKHTNKFFDFIKNNNIKQPTRQDILDFKNSLTNRLKPATVTVYLISVKIFFQWLEQEGLYPDVTKRVKSPKISKDHRKDALTTTQTKMILESIDRSTTQGLRDYAMILLMVTGGLRTIEVVRANLEDMRNLGDNTVLYIQGKGQNEKTDYVKLPFGVEIAIRNYLTEAKINNPKEPLFQSLSTKNYGSRLTTRSISRVIKTHMRENKIDSPRLTAHSLRHTAATVNLMSGGTLEETQQLLRHKNINTTMIYAHHLDRLNNESENRIINYIFESTHP